MTTPTNKHGPGTGGFKVKIKDGHISAAPYMWDRTNYLTFSNTIELGKAARLITPDKLVLEVDINGRLQLNKYENGGGQTWFRQRGGYLVLSINATQHLHVSDSNTLVVRSSPVYPVSFVPA